MKALTIKPTYKQHVVYEALKEKDIVFFGGGGGGGKSWLICESRLINAIMKPGYKSFIGREELKRLMQSTYETWRKVCSYHSIPESMWKLNGQYNYIEFTNGSRIDLLDLKFQPSDPLYERFGSLEYTDGAIEEAGEVDFRAFDVLKSRVNRHMNKELGIRATILITGNPKKNWTYQLFYKPWRDDTLPSNFAFIQSLYRDNPYTAEDYGRTLSMISDRSLRERLKEGNWDYEDEENSLLFFNDIQTLFLPPSTQDPAYNQPRYMTVDPAFGGTDEAVFYIWRDFTVEKCFAYPKLEHDNMIQLIDMYARENHIPKRNIVVDAIGEGAYIPKFIKGIRGFIGGSSPLENDRAYLDEMKKPFFLNLRSQCIWEMSQMIKKHKVAFLPVDVTVRTKLVEELQLWKLKYVDDDKKLQVIGKDEMKESLGRSTDYSDPLYMRMFFELNGEKVLPAVSKRQQEINAAQPFNKWGV